MYESKSPRDDRAKREAEVKVSPFSLLSSGEVSFAFGEDKPILLRGENCGVATWKLDPFHSSLQCSHRDTYMYFVHFVHTRIVLRTLMYTPVYTYVNFS